VTSLTTVSAQEALEVCLRELDLLIRESNAKIICEQPLPLVHSDQFSLARVFSNLISNSIKYRSNAEPVIRITAVSDGPFVRFSSRTME